MIKELYIDLDGVLADFYTAAIGTFGKMPGTVFDPLPQRYAVWDLLGVSDEVFWNECRGQLFWEHLPLTKMAYPLMAAVESIVPTDRIWLLSKPRWDDPGCYSGKWKWVRKNFPEYSRRLILCQEKYLLAKPGTFLIDDCEENCSQFYEYGGEPMLVPSPWNRHHYAPQKDFILKTTRTLAENMK